MGRWSEYHKVSNSTIELWNFITQSHLCIKTCEFKISLNRLGFPTTVISSESQRSSNPNMSHLSKQEYIIVSRHDVVDLRDISMYIGHMHSLNLILGKTVNKVSGSMTEAIVPCSLSTYRPSSLPNAIHHRPHFHVKV